MVADMLGLVGFLGAATPSLTPSLIGYSGLFNVPTAEVRQDMALAFRWLDAPEYLLRPPGTDRVNRNYLIALPLLSFLEISMGMLQVIGWYDPQVPLLPYAVHRTFAVKARLPVDWPGPGLAVGVIDPVSANFLAFGPGLKTHYGLTTVYVVGTQRLGPLMLTAGWGQGDEDPRKDSRKTPFLHGPFGGLAWALPGGLEILAEYDGATTNWGVRWIGPWGLGLQGGQVGGGLSAGMSLSIRL